MTISQKTIHYLVHSETGQSGNANINKIWWEVKTMHSITDVTKMQLKILIIQQNVPSVVEYRDLPVPPQTWVPCSPLRAWWPVSVTVPPSVPAHGTQHLGPEHIRSAAVTLSTVQTKNCYIKLDLRFSKTANSLAANFLNKWIRNQLDQNAGYLWNAGRLLRGERLLQTLQLVRQELVAQLNFFHCSIASKDQLSP